jgi:hypothetical protein
MFLITTILSFSVIVPLLVGIFSFRHLSNAYKMIVYLCAIWLAAEIYSYILRINNIVNAHVSYSLTAFEIFLYALFYYNACRNQKAQKLFYKIAPLGLVLIVADYLMFDTPLNTFSLSVEYIVLTGMGLYLFYEISIGLASKAYSLINFTLLFYLLSSFPYFFAWEWLRVANMDLLMIFNISHLLVHTICYFVMGFVLWKSSLSYSVR